MSNIPLQPTSFEIWEKKYQLEDAGIQFTVVDAEENPDYCRNYGVRGLPTTLFFEDGELVKSLVGNNPVKEYIWRFPNGSRDIRS